MDENELKKRAKRELVIFWMFFVLSLIAHICFDVYTIVTFLNVESGQLEKYVFSVSGIAITFILSLKFLVSDIIPYTKDVRFYKNHDVEKIRAEIIKIKRLEVSSCKVTVRNLENGDEETFEFVGNEVQKGKIYDFIYLKHSRVHRYRSVTLEELTEANREKAGKIDLNRKD